MNTSVITKVLNKSKEFQSVYTVGFSRLLSLPVRVRTDISLACVMKGEFNQESVKEFLNTLTEQEFINWLKLR